MRSAFKNAIVFATVFVFSSISLHAQDSLVKLTYQDVPRGFLGEASTRAMEPQSKGVGIPFLIPNSIKDGIVYGVDLSHHSFAGGQKVNWDELANNKISFVYLKATEGTNYYDGTFQDSWRSLGSVAQPPLRGAYHFLRAQDDPGKQAELFIKFLREKSDYVAGRDLPPVVDLEWDCRRDKKGRPIYRDGRCAHDNWADLTPEQIVSNVNVFLFAIKKAFGVDAVVYTSTAWWNERSLSNADLAGQFLAQNKIWIADYTRGAQKSSKPVMPKGKTWLLWQFTDNGKLTESCNPADKNSNCTDTNAVTVSLEEFKEQMGITKK